MANLKTFSGFPIQNLTSDPVPFAQAKINDPYVGVWSSGGAMNTARVFDATAQTGGNSAGQIAGGTYPTGPSAVNTEQYNGTAWTEVNNLNAGRYDIFGTGTQTSAIAASGYTTTWVGNTETWNGSTWTEVADVNQARKEGGSSGISATSALIFGGEGSPSSTPYALTESWNGSSWTEVGDLNGAIYGTSGGGTQTDAIRAGGVTTGSGNPSATVETWNGTAWTETTDINTSRGYNAASAANSTAALIAGGTTNTGPSLSVLTENWNGSSWTEVNDLATARYKVNGSGTSTEALAIGGGPNTSGGTATEEWAFSGIPPTAPAAGYSDAIVGQMYYNSTSGQFKAIKDGGAPIGTWASGGNLNAAKQNNAGAGTQTSAMSIDSESGTDVELYNGTSWTETTENNTARRYASANGPSGNTNVIFMGGYSTTNTGDTEIWNGSSWTEVNNLNVGRNNLGSAGTSTANVAFGGEGNPPVGGNLALTELWNGSSWTEVNDLNEGRNSKTGAGTSTAALSTDGAPNTNAELWDGTSWTETTNFNTSRNGSVMTNSSPQNDAILITGQTAPGSFITNCEHWNGTSWTEIADVGTAMVRGGGAGSGGTSGIKFGGSTPSVTASTEEFTAADFTINPVTTS